MPKVTASIRQLRTDFRAVRRKIEEHGEVVITDRGNAVYMMKSLPRRSKAGAVAVDYYARLIKQQPKPMSPEATRKFWEEERGSR